MSNSRLLLPAQAHQTYCPWTSWWWASVRLTCMIVSASIRAGGIGVWSIARPHYPQCARLSLLSWNRRIVNHIYGLRVSRIEPIFCYFNNQSRKRITHISLCVNRDSVDELWWYGNGEMRRKFSVFTVIGLFGFLKAHSYNLLRRLENWALQWRPTHDAYLSFSPVSLHSLSKSLSSL